MIRPGTSGVGQAETDGGFSPPTMLGIGRRPGWGVVGPGIGGRIAQLVEQLTLNQRAVGSSPTAPTKPFNRLA